jgi:hypothetical protein
MIQGSNNVSSRRLRGKLCNCQLPLTIKNCVEQIADPDHGYKHAPGQMAAPQKSADGSVTVETRWMEGKDNS